jgi:histidinol-phosphate aminotransferase
MRERADAVAGGPVPAGSAGELPRAARALAAAIGVPLDHIIKLDANEGVHGLPPAAQRALMAFAAGGVASGRYPDPAAYDLRAALTDYTGVGADGIVVGNGSEEVTHLLAGELLGPGDEIVVSEPTFGLYALAARRAGAAVISVPLDDDFTVRVAGMVKAVTPRTRMAFVCAPNNPTGTPVDAGVFEELARRVPLLVVDEAYHEFARLSNHGAGATGADETSAHPVGWSSAVELVMGGQTVVVMRTLSKAFGLAGLRVGYALGPVDLARRLRARKAPFNVNAAGQIAAEAALGETQWMLERVAETVAERERLAGRLASLPGLRVYPSAANFLLVEWMDGGAEGSLPLYRGLLRRGILVRRVTEPRLAACLRITVGTPREHDAVVGALSELVAG